MTRSAEFLRDVIYALAINGAGFRVAEQVNKDALIIHVTKGGKEGTLEFSGREIRMNSTPEMRSSLINDRLAKIDKEMSGE